MWKYTSFVEIRQLCGNTPDAYQSKIWLRISFSIIAGVGPAWTFRKISVACSHLVVDGIVAKLHCYIVCQLQAPNCPGVLWDMFVLKVLRFSFFFDPSALQKLKRMLLKIYLNTSWSSTYLWQLPEIEGRAGEALHWAVAKGNPPGYPPILLAPILPSHSSKSNYYNDGPTQVVVCQQP